MKFIQAIALIGAIFVSTGASADIGGKVGVASDNYFRGHNISDGFGYHVGGHADWNGFHGGVKLMSLSDDADADHFMISKLGYGLDIGGMKINLSYNDYSYQGGDAEGWEEVGIGANFDHFGVKYHMGLDDAGDFFEIHSGFFKVVDVAYGDWDNAGSYWHISKGWDLFKGHVKVGYIDHEDNEDDFSDKITDVDNFYIGYSLKF
jgi:hypothetical protein